MSIKDSIYVSVSSMADTLRNIIYKNRKEAAIYAVMAIEECIEELQGEDYVEFVKLFKRYVNKIKDEKQ